MQRRVGIIILALISSACGSENAPSRDLPLIDSGTQLQGTITGNPPTTSLEFVTLTLNGNPVQGDAVAINNDDSLGCNAQVQSTHPNITLVKYFRFETETSVVEIQANEVLGSTIEDLIPASVSCRAEVYDENSALLDQKRSQNVRFVAHLLEDDKIREARDAQISDEGIRRR